MRQFTPKHGTLSATCVLKKPLAGIEAFTAVLHEIVQQNPLGCTPYRTVKKQHPPVRKVRERYTAKFVYMDPAGKQIGSSSEVYDSVEGYENGIHAVMANLANITAHRGKARHLRESDHFTVILQCHSEGGELFFLSLSRDRITVASYTSDAIRKSLEKWAERSPALSGVISAR